MAFNATLQGNRRLRNAASRRTRSMRVGSHLKFRASGRRKLGANRTKQLDALKRK